MLDPEDVARERVNRRPVSQLRFIAFVVAPMVFLGLSTLVSMQNFRTVLANQYRVQQTYETKSKLDELNGLLGQVVADHRGYIIGAIPDYLSAYRGGVREIRATITELQKMLSSDPGQRERMRQIDAAFQTKIAELDQLVLLRSDGTRGNARERFVTPESRAETNRIRGLIQEMQASESVLLARRSESTEQSSNISILTLWLNLALGLILAGILGFLSWRYRKLREEAQLAERRYVDDLEEKVLERTAELNATNAELEAFSYSVSHDLRAPLRAMSGYASMLEEDFGDGLNDDAKDSIGRIKAASSRMSNLIDGLLRLSRITRSEMTETEVDLSILAQEILGELQSRHPEMKTDLMIESGLRVQGDAQLLRILMENLLRNAWKYSSKGEVIQVAFRRVPNTDPEQFVVEDNGVGFDINYADHLFEPFQRLHSERDFEGTGIGLAICKRITTRHGGKIWADSTVGKGSKFSFSLAPDPEDYRDAVPGIDRALASSEY